MSDNDTWLPLFPLNTVLFPSGILHLRVFESRYMDMVRECMKRKAPFGVVLIKSGKEAGVAPEPENIGCLAHIAQWDTAADPGMMLLRAQGGERFRILQTRELADHRLEARVEIIAAAPFAPISDIHVRCAATLKIVIDDINAKNHAERSAAFSSTFAQQIHLDDAGWVANRWCEILPIPLKARQKLLELDDAQSRLKIVYQYLQQHKIV